MQNPKAHFARGLQVMKTSVDASVNAVKWKGLFTYGAGHLDDNFEIRIYPDIGGLPASSSVTGSIYQAVLGNVPRHLTGEKVFDTYSVYEFSSAIPQFDVHAGTKYWIEMIDNIGTSQWLWSCSDIVDGGNGVTDYTGDWEHHIQLIEFTFQLSGEVVPEPSTFVLLVVGTAGPMLLGMIRRRQ